MNVSHQQVRVHVAYDFHQPHLLCPKCGQAGPYYDLREERTLHQLDRCQFQTLLVARLPRIQCRRHGVKTIAAPWCEPHSRFTLAFECFAIAILTATGVQSQVAVLLRLSPIQVQELMGRNVERGLARLDHNVRLSHLSLDEKSFKQGYHYISVLATAWAKAFSMSSRAALWKPPSVGLLWSPFLAAWPCLWGENERKIRSIILHSI